MAIGNLHNSQFGRSCGPRTHPNRNCVNSQWPAVLAIKSSIMLAWPWRLSLTGVPTLISQGVVGCIRTACLLVHSLDVGTDTASTYTHHLVNILTQNVRHRSMMKKYTRISKTNEVFSMGRYAVELHIECKDWHVLMVVDISNSWKIVFHLFSWNLSHN